VKLRLPVRQPSITLIRGTCHESTASDFDGAADPLGLTRLLENLRFSLPDSCREQPSRPTIGSLPENAVHGNGQGQVRRRQARADQTSSPRRLQARDARIRPVSEWCVTRSELRRGRHGRRYGTTPLSFRQFRRTIHASTVAYNPGRLVQANRPTRGSAGSLGAKMEKYAVVR
jgi:hypothetical protein